MKWDILLSKIELQSVLVLVFTLYFGTSLLKTDNSFSSPAGILGTISIAFGILYTFISFLSNQIKESYTDVINQYKETISNLRTSQQSVENILKDQITQSHQPQNLIGNYQIPREDQASTISE